MKKNDATVSDNLPTVSKYSAVSTDVWNLFKKYLPTSADLTNMGDDIHALDLKYRDQELYHFMQKLLKVYFDELGSVRNEKNQN